MKEERFFLFLFNTPQKLILECNSEEQALDGKIP